MEITGGTIQKIFLKKKISQKIKITLGENYSYFVGNLFYWYADCRFKKRMS